jgi:hypothetical protein
MLNQKCGEITPSGSGRVGVAEHHKVKVSILKMMKML